MSARPRGGRLPSPSDSGLSTTVVHIGRHRILVYYKHGLVSPVVSPERGGYYFNDEGVRTLRRIEYLHTDCGINMTGTRMILELQNEVERLRNEVRFLRE